MKTTLTLSTMLLLVTAVFGQWFTIEMPRGRIQLSGAASYHYIYIAGGIDATGYPLDIFAFDTEEQSWSSSSLSLSVGRAKLACVFADGKLFCGGGIVFEEISELTVLDIIDVATGDATTAELSVGRMELSAVTVGDKVLFAGGLEALSLGDFGDPVPMVAHDAVDIYDLTTNTWSTAQLSQARGGMAHAVAGNKAFFAGGYRGNGQVSDVVDIYDAATNSWSTATLSQARVFYGGGVGNGNKVFFAGGTLPGDIVSNRVDIYDLSTDTWSVDSLSAARQSVQAAALGDKVYFAGGSDTVLLEAWISYTFSDVVDIYDLQTNTWSVNHMTNRHINHACLSAGNQLFVAGGFTPDWDLLATVDVYTDESTGTNNPANNHKLDLYPNPVADELTIRFQNPIPHNTRIFLTDATGRLVHTLQADSQVIRLNAGHLPKGMYLLNVQSEAGADVWKVVKG